VFFVVGGWQTEGPSMLHNSLARATQREMDVRFVTWNVRSVQRAGSLKSTARELAKCKVDLIGVQTIWRKGDSEPADNSTFYLIFHRKEGWLRTKC
jgi:hypothetical protein